jgi:hypothetical protein
MTIADLARRIEIDDRKAARLTISPAYRRNYGR